MKSDEQLVSLATLSRKLGIPIAWLCREVSQGRLPHLRAQRTLLFDVGAVVECLRKRAAQNPPGIEPAAEKRTQGDNPQGKKGEKNEITADSQPEETGRGI